LIEDPNDLFAQYLLKLAENFSVSAQTFASVYLLSHGVLKLFIVVTLLQKKTWAYPVALVILGLLMLYQVYLLIFDYKIEYLFLAIFDTIVLILVWIEYRSQKRLRKKSISKLDF